MRKNGEEFPIRLDARNVPYKGKQVRTVEFRDITEAKQAEKEREKLQNQLNQAQKMEAVGRLAGGVAHDFNNMLSVILGFTELTLLKADESEPFYNDLKEVYKAAKRSSEITRQLLAFARQQTIAPKVLDMNMAIESMLKMLQRLLGESTELTWVPGKDLWPVKIDPSQIDQILANLCVNARDAIADIGRISIETHNINYDEDACANLTDVYPGDFVQIVVSDTGNGMEPETLDNLFEPFYTTKDTHKGTGLGLATVYGIVKQNQGFIKVYSEPGIGTSFKIYLPRHKGKAEPFIKESIPATTLGGDETILIVEDEPSILSMAEIMLQKLGYTVLASDHPTDAIKLAKNHDAKIHLVITDVIMPGINGRELVDRLTQEHPELKYLFMSGYTADVISRHGVLDKGVQFIQKPFSMQTLAIKVRQAIE